MNSTESLVLNSEILIGIIGQENILDPIREIVKAFPNFNPFFCEFVNEDEIPDVYLNILSKVEVILFTEHRHYNIIIDNFDLTIPLHYLTLDGAGLYRSLFRLKNTPILSSLTVDTIEKKYIEQIIYELGETHLDFTYFEHSSTSSIEEIVKFHIKEHQQTGTIALTGIYAVSIMLDNFNVPNELVKPTHQDIIVALERALLSTEIVNTKNPKLSLVL